MLSAKRHETILEMLDKENMIKVSDLSKELGVTEKTIRMDLMTLEEKGLLQRVHGGAVPVQSSGLFPIAERQEKHIAEKQRIAEKAVESIVDGDTIYLDGGSTMREIAKLLDQHRVTVITNDLRIASIIAEMSKPDLVMLGGMPVGSTTSLYGPLAKDALKNIHVKHLFLATTGLSMEHGLTVFHTLHAEYKRKL
ncbi:DeoR/GlpR family DNA-binding transcription regulator [Bacillus sp. N9]